MADLNDLAACDLVIEAVFEDRGVKAAVTKEAEVVLADSAVFASNTSALPITELAQASVRPKNFIGMHFFSPAERMPLVEIITGDKTSDEALAKAFDFAQLLGKKPIVVKDSPGFFTTRVIGQTITQGQMMLVEGVNPALIENAAAFNGLPHGTAGNPGQYLHRDGLSRHEADPGRCHRPWRGTRNRAPVRGCPHYVRGGWEQGPATGRQLLRLR